MASTVGSRRDSVDSAAAVSLLGLGSGKPVVAAEAVLTPSASGSDVGSTATASVAQAVLTAPKTPAKVSLFNRISQCVSSAASTVASRIASAVSSFFKPLCSAFNELAKFASQKKTELQAYFAKKPAAATAGGNVGAKADTAQKAATPPAAEHVDGLDEEEEGAVDLAATGGALKASRRPPLVAAELVAAAPKAGGHVA